jgi:hypothetical protein
MTREPQSEEEQLAELLGLLPPAPAAWIAAAAAIPSTERALEDIRARVLADAEARDAVTADLERALREAGLAQPTARDVAALRDRLDRI